MHPLSGPDKMLVEISEEEEILVLTPDILLHENDIGGDEGMNGNIPRDQDLMDFNEELQIIQRDVFAQPEISWKHLDKKNNLEEDYYCQNNNNVLFREKDVWWPTLKLDMSQWFSNCKREKESWLPNCKRDREAWVPNCKVETAASEKENLDQEIVIKTEPRKSNTAEKIERITAKYRATEISSRANDTRRRDGTVIRCSGKQKPGYVRLIIQNDEISVPSSKDPMFSKPVNKRKLKQLNGNVLILSTETSPHKNNQKCSLLSSNRSKSAVSHTNKRDVMNNAERMRRNEISEKFRELSQMIPQRFLSKCESKQSSGASKIKVLDSARKYCVCLQTTLARVEGEIETETLRNNRLKVIHRNMIMKQHEMYGMF